MPFAFCLLTFHFSPFLFYSTMLRQGSSPGGFGTLPPLNNPREDSEGSVDYRAVPLTPTNKPPLRRQSSLTEVKSSTYSRYRRLKTVPELSSEEVKTFIEGLPITNTLVSLSVVAQKCFDLDVDGRCLMIMGSDSFDELGVKSAVGRAQLISLIQRADEEARNSGWIETETHPETPVSSGFWSLFRMHASEFPWVDHKHEWFERIIRSGRTPHAIRTALMGQMESYTVMYLLFMSTIIPSAYEIAPQIGADFNSISFHFAIVFIFITMLGGILAAHVANTMMAATSDNNLLAALHGPIMNFMVECSMSLIAVMFPIFFVIISFTIQHFTDETPTWAKWLLFLPVLLFLPTGFPAVWLTASYRRGRTTLPGVIGGATYTRMLLHSGCFNNEPLNIKLAGRTRNEVMEDLSQRAIKDKEITKSVGEVVWRPGSRAWNDHVEGEVRPGQSTDPTIDKKKAFGIH